MKKQISDFLKKVISNYNEHKDDIDFANNIYYGDLGHELFNEHSSNEYSAYIASNDLWCIMSSQEFVSTDRKEFNKVLASICQDLRLSISSCDNDDEEDDGSFIIFIWLISVMNRAY